MRTLFLASTALITGSAAFAADLPARMPVKAPVAVAAPYSWTGCYVGGHIGAGWAHTNFSDALGNRIAPVGSEVQVDSDASFLGGGQVGCDYQFAANWVIGLAGDFSWASIDGVADDPFFSGKTAGVPLTLHSRTDFLATATGRIGYAWNTLLVYGKGGFAWSHDKYQVNNFSCVIFTSCNTNANETRTGWTAGGGVEWAFMPNWSLLVEYNHYGFGTNNLTFIDPTQPGSPAAFGVKQDFDAVKVGVNYRFGWMR
jgi:outer membrane immunogenic protein